MPTLHQIIITALLSAFTVIVADKTEIRYKLRDLCCISRIRVPRLVKMLECDFCFGFWIAVIISVILAILTNDVNWLITPFMSSPLTRFII